MSFGFLGIQFGFALQGGFMSRIFQTLGANEHDIPMLWIAAPLTGLIVQPIIGYLSDKTWHARWGRRRPFFLIGAVLSSLALFAVPHSSVLWMAAGSLWVLDASINISMEPFRALVADKLPNSQRSYGFVMQTLIIGIGTWVASNLPLFITKMGVSNVADPGVVPMSVKVAFAVGAVVFIASMLITVFTTDEYPPEDMEAFEEAKKNAKNPLVAGREILSNIQNMPLTMKRLGLVQFFSWFAFFAMWSMATPALTAHVYNAPKPQAIHLNVASDEVIEGYQLASQAYNDAADQVGANMGMYGLSSMAFALLLTLYTSRRKINRRNLHMASLMVGALGFFSMFWMDSPDYLGFAFMAIGVAWASILSMPYAMLSSFIDGEKMGVFMGLFNMFIVIPQIVAATSLVAIYTFLFGDSAINAMLLAGLSLAIASLSNLLIVNPEAVKD
jgi:maltose/moltooligosaccharide transporter